MNRTKYWINTFYSYIKKDKLRIILTILVGGISLYMISFAFTFLDQASKAESKFHTYIYLSSTIPSSEIGRITTYIKKQYPSSSIQIKSPGEKLKQLINNSRRSNLLIKLIPYTITVSSRIPIKIKLPKEFTKYIIRQTTTAPGEKELRKITNIIRTFLVFISLTLMVGIVLITIFTLHLSFITHHKEIEILKLLGATRVFIATPLYMEGLFIGGMSGITGVILINLTRIWVEKYKLPILWLLPKTHYQLLIFIIGIFLGLVSSFIGTTTQLRHDEE